MRGPAGRRAVIGAAVLGLLAVSLSAAEGGVGHLVHRQPARTAGQPSEAVPGRSGCSALAVGIRLLHQAVRAARRVSYQGVQVISWRTPGGSGAWLGSGASRVTVDVWHRYGVGTLTRVTAPSHTWSDDDRDQGSPQTAGMLGLTPALIGLLCTHYTVRPDGMGSADGRRARIVEALRGNGSLAARFWLDSATKLPLRRELFDPEARLISDDDFVGLALGARSARRAFAGPASSSPPGSSSSPAASPSPAGTGSPSPAGTGHPDDRAPAVAGHPGAAFRPWADQLGPAQLATLRDSGWPVPGPMPSGLTLFDARQSATAAGRVVDLAYSDGLSVVSLFVQRGRLPAALPGWHQTDVNGHRLYVSNPGEPDLTWSAGGFVYTLVAGAPAPTVAAVVNALPHEAGFGFWARMKRGLRRVWSWINPFR
jgi:sigma-E factor negative regulatory protein RseB